MLTGTGTAPKASLQSYREPILLSSDSL